LKLVGNLYRTGQTIISRAEEEIMIGQYLGFAEKVRKAIGGIFSLFKGVIKISFCFSNYKKHNFFLSQEGKNRRKRVFFEKNEKKPA
jgi:hypothetical protein